VLLSFLEISIAMSLIPFIDKVFDDDFFGMTMRPSYRPMPLMRNLETNADAILRQSSPCFEIHEDDTKFQLSVEVPGVKVEDMTVQVEQNGRVLRLSGGRKIKKGDEVTETHFEKSFRLHRNIDASKITANLADGILIVTAPKGEATTTVNIPVSHEPIEAHVREFAADHRLAHK
jgi:HSP20 family molecular chaperone IbpA